MNVEKTLENLRKNGFSATYFDTAAEASEYLNRVIDGKTVGIGGSMTVREMGLAEQLKTHNEVFWHWDMERQTLVEEASGAQVYISSVNGLSEQGELINIDGRGNRVASTLFGHEKLYFIVGVNKLEETFDQALWRARNIASPLNAKRLNKNTPCAKNADRCYDCKSPERICNGLVVLWKNMMGADTEVVLIGESLGY